MFSLKKEHLKNIDYWMVLCMCALIGIGILAISSATTYSGDTEVLKMQLLFFATGIVLMLFVMAIDYHFLGEWYIPIYIAFNLLLIAVFFLGKNVNGATRWIQIGPMTIQPSEFAKIGVILCTAKLLDKYNDKINSFKSLMIVGLFHFIPFILVNRQPNLSTSLVILGILVIQLFVSKLDMKVMISTAAIAVATAGIILVYIITNPYQKIIPDYQRNRIVTKVHGGDNLDENYQTNQSVHAIGSGGLEGKGLYQGAISQLNYLPESHNDFIVAIIAEEFGFVGILIVLGIILFMIARGLWIAHSAPDDFGRFIIAGYMGMIAMQTFVNMGVVTSLLPNTGLPLPFISYGGSSLWANMMGLGLVLNVGMRKENTMF
ncbi:rod shape-determining protein RodA [Niameybacter massiliensis]|uniref:Rod shape-determining protein RodA n=1 Tax=Holtiella tumoricola TaxID=3018743 RepID=A0AA42DQS8_9FIRM|nr:MULTISPECIES: rod shape-determining protein RodA [Lachnospirales]MDA3733649.1 rod shape-determining protein RodA [Holtiella tumoricola]